MSDNVIEAENLTKRYNGPTVVNGISFSVARGEIFGSLSPSRSRVRAATDGATEDAAESPEEPARHSSLTEAARLRPHPSVTDGGLKVPTWLPDPATG